MSILCVLSKVLERAVHSQLGEYLEKRGLIFDHQSGFRGGYSTDSCLVGLSDYIRGEIGKGNLVGMVLIDLQKAFDTVDHAILLDKLSAIGVSSTAWFESYLCDRKQCVEVNGSRSEFLPIDCGVPQGSILGPQLFLIYINDMNLSVNCSLSLYADDSALVFSHRDPGVIGARLSHELFCCKQWLIDNKLSLHIGKTECMLFGSCRKLKRAGNFQVTCEGMAVKQVYCVKYLGVHLDSDMSGKTQVRTILKTCAGRLAFLYRNASLLDKTCRTILCSALIQPFIDYCCSSWYSGVTVSLKGRLDVVQRKMVRFVNNWDPRHHVSFSDIRGLSWIPIPDRVEFFKMMHLFRIRHNLAPRYLLPNFKSISSVHSHNTRGSNLNFSLPKYLSLSPHSFAFTAIKQWNQLPTGLKSIVEFRVYKQRLKSHYLSKQD